MATAEDIQNAVAILAALKQGYDMFAPKKEPEQPREKQEKPSPEDLKRAYDNVGLYKPKFDNVEGL